MIIKNGSVFTPDGVFRELSIATEDDQIKEVGSLISDADNAEEFDATGMYVIPGLTDVHFHGCACQDFCYGTKEAIDTIAKFEFTQGVTTILPTTMTISGERLDGICEAAAAYKEEQLKGTVSDETADLVGIHMEGPYISKNKKGAQNEEFIVPASGSQIRNWIDKSKGLVKLISLAPETTGAIDVIKECAGKVRFSIAHTESDYDTAIKAFEAGADHVTHLYNAMPPFTHRAPGVIGAAADTKKAFVELICDGVHIHPAVIRSTFKLFGDDRMVLISDTMEAAGMPDGKYALGGQDVFVKGSHATLADGTLAGSVTPLYKCFKNVVEFGIPLESAVKAATINPCKSVGIDKEYGSIEAGKKARFLILDKNDLSIKAVIKGQKIYR
ncbi:MAG: N-acetylglucosamine-6-phosphate deacetylase [Lachnospiraceae bacterium]|nr:N-acetylglucosamine-6-phosphate deacetylase [Lachnospiraceae bacterium]